MVAMTVVALGREFIATAGPSRYLVEQALGVPIEIAQAFGLQMVGDCGIADGATGDRGPCDGTSNAILPAGLGGRDRAAVRSLQFAR
jgi:hypothetical protein